MADSAQSQAPASGGGEGPVTAVPNLTEIPQETKPVEAIQTNEQKEVKKESEAPAVEVKPAEVKSAEVKPAELNSADIKPAEVKSVEAPKQEEVKPLAPDANANQTVTDANESNVEQSSASATTTENWQQREQELLKKIEELEKIKGERNEDGLKLELNIREDEIDLLKARVRNLETQLQATLAQPGGKNQELIDKIKEQHEELLTKARGMIFDKTKMVKNQELQIEALTTQIQSLKDINQITKDLLEIRNSEVKAMEERFLAMEARFKAEKERYDLVLKRAQTSTNINDDLRKEYETQLAIFKELREKYEQRVQALVAENTRLKESLKGGPSG